jgi:RNA polymerase sigma-70 factor (ECF subfamily)
MDDREIVALFFERSETAIKEADLKYGKYCYSIANRILDNEEDAKEVVNDTYLKAWNTIPPKRPDVLRTYLAHIIRNLAISRYRSEHAEKRVHAPDSPLHELSECLPDPEGSPAEAASMAELRQTLNAFVAGLEEVDRKLFVGRYFHSYTPRQLAGVWMGYDYPAPLKGIHGNPCVGVWNDLMAVCEARYKGSPPKAAFDMPEGLVEAEYCPLSGRAHTEACADPVGGCEAARGWFVKGTEPRLPCDVHKEAPIRWVPLDPADPHRIPLLPGDVLTETTPSRLPDPARPDKRPFFWFFGRRRRANEY